MALSLQESPEWREWPMRRTLQGSLNVGVELVRLSEGAESISGVDDMQVIIHNTGYKSAVAAIRYIENEFFNHS